MQQTKTFYRLIAILAIVLVAAAVVIVLAVGLLDEDEEDDDVASLNVSNAWVRATVGEVAETDDAEMAEAEPGGVAQSTVTGAFMTIENPGDEVEHLISASVDESIAAIVELHETTVNEDDVMQMRQVEQIEVPANGSVELAPGGYHIMLIGVQESLDPGDTVALTLAFDSGKEFTVEAEVREVSG